MNLDEWLEKLKTIRNEALAVMGILFSILIKWEDFVKLYNQDQIKFALTILLAVYAISWFYAYYKVGFQEQKWLAKYLDPELVSEIGLGTFLIVLSLAISFVLLIYVSDNILLYSIFISILCYIDLWVLYLLRKKLKRAMISKIESTENKIEKDKVLGLFKYYYIYPWGQRIATTLVINLVAVILVIISTNLTENKRLLVLTAYVLIILSNSCSLLIQQFYRNKTNKLINA